MYIFFPIKFLALECPGDGSCSENGRCDYSKGKCLCGEGYQGRTCKGKIDVKYFQTMINYL